MNLAWTNQLTNDTSLLTTTQLLIRIRAFQHRCWKQGNPISIETLLQAYPSLQQDDESTLELIYGEYCVRESLGEEPTPDLYCQQFPHLTDRLERLLEVHRAIESGNPSFASVRQTVQFSNDNSVSISPETETRVLPATDQEPGHQPQASLGLFGEYHLMEEIDRGGMGIVYRAKQLQAKRVVALKMILAGKFATKKELKRFYSEAAAAAKLDHPNIVPIYEVGEQDGHPFFTMAYVDGQNLAARIQQGPLAQREAAALAGEIAGAIEYAHQRGIVHRDLKPANILLTANGQTRITDFGLAKQIGDHSDLTVTGDVVGTPSFMSPEQVTGNHADVDVGSDIYSLGAILYCLLTGRPPFQAATILETFTQLIETDPVSPRQLVPTLSTDLETICLKCLQKDPSKRYLSAADLLDDLERYLDGKPVQARPVSQLERCWRWCQRKPIIALLSATVTFLVCLVAIVSSMAAFHLQNMTAKESLARHRAEDAQEVAELEQRRYQQAKQLADRKTVAAIEHLQTATREKKTAQHNLYAAHMNLAQMAWEHAHAENVQDLLHQQGNPSIAEDIRRFEWYYLNRLCHQDTATLKPGFMTHSVVYGPDDDQLLLGTHDGTLVCWDLSRQQATFSTVLHQGRINEIALGPDGRQVATAGNDGIVAVWDFQQRKVQWKLAGGSGHASSVCFNHDATQLATGNADGTIKIWNLRTGECVQTLHGHQHDVLSVCFNSDSTLLATGSLDNTARIWNTSSAETLFTIGHRGSVDCVQFSAANNMLATASSDATIKLWSTSQQRPYQTIDTGQSAVRHIQFSPDGKHLLSAGADSTIKLWELARAAEIRSFKGHFRPVGWLAFRPDGQEFVSASWDLTVKQWALSPPPSTLKAHQHVVQDLDYSADGKWLVTASADKTIKLWQLPERRLTHVFSSPTVPFRTVRFSPDGKWLAAGRGDGLLQIWNLADKRLQVTQQLHQQQINQLAFTSDSRWIGSASDDGLIKLWNVTEQQLAGNLRGARGAVKTIAFSPDGSQLVSGGRDRILRIWDRETQQLTQEIPGHDGEVLTVAWSPDGNWIASSGYDRSIHVRDVAQGVQRFQLKGHTGPVTQIRFSPDSQRIASTSYDRSLKLWDTVYGNQVLTLRGHRAVTWCVQFSPSGNWIVSGSSDSTVRFWDGRPGHESSPAENRSVRIFQE